MDELIGGVAKSMAGQGPAWALVVVFLLAIAVVGRALWQWGFREPNADKKDPGGRITRAMDKHMEMVDKLTDQVQVTHMIIEGIDKNGCARMRHPNPAPAAGQ